MNREIEYKILDVTPEIIGERLKKLGAEMIGRDLQRIYTYDFLPMEITISGILRCLGGEIEERKRRPLRRQLEVLLADLADLVSPEEEYEVLTGTGVGALSELASRFELLAPTLRGEVINRIVRVTEGVGINPNKWVRLRTSSGAATIAVKHIWGRKGEGGNRHHAVDAVREVELTIQGFEVGRQLLEGLGFFHKNYQEKRRTSFRLWQEVAVDIDEWPGIPPYLEIEGASEREVLRAAEALGFSRDKLRGMNADDVFAYYGKDMYENDELKFSLD